MSTIYGTLPKRIDLSVAAGELLLKLTKRNGPLMFHQSGGCCDNSAANCYLPGEITMGAGDVYLGDIGGSPFYIGLGQYEYWKHTHIEIDVVPGRGGGFSLETPEGFRFIIRSRLFTDAEYEVLKYSPVLLGNGEYKLV